MTVVQPLHVGSKQTLSHRRRYPGLHLSLAYLTPNTRAMTSNQIACRVDMQLDVEFMQLDVEYMQLDAEYMQLDIE